MFSQFANKFVFPFSSLPAAPAYHQQAYVAQPKVVAHQPLAYGKNIYYS